MKPPIMDLIQKKGYWKITFTPLSHRNRIAQPTDCLAVVEKNNLEVTGWDYPHVSKRNDGTGDFGPGNNYYQSWTNFEEYKELWRFYQSGKFIHYRCVWEDWTDVRQISGLWRTREEENLPTIWLGVTRTTYLITQIVEFLARLCKENLYEDGVEISIELINTEGRCLVVDHPNRVPMMQKYITQGSVLNFAKTFTREIVIEHTKDIAFEIVNHFFVRFGWRNLAVAVIRQDIENLLKGRLE